MKKSRDSIKSKNFVFTKNPFKSKLKAKFTNFVNTIYKLLNWMIKLLKIQ